MTTSVNHSLLIHDPHKPYQETLFYFISDFTIEMWSRGLIHLCRTMKRTCSLFYEYSFMRSYSIWYKMWCFLFQCGIKWINLYNMWYCNTVKLIRYVLQSLTLTAKVPECPENAVQLAEMANCDTETDQFEGSTVRTQDTSPHVSSGHQGRLWCVPRYCIHTGLSGDHPTKKHKISHLGSKPAGKYKSVTSWSPCREIQNISISRSPCMEPQNCDNLKILQRNTELCN
jgi:hypothetical protein